MAIGTEGEIEQMLHPGGIDGGERNDFYQAWLSVAETERRV